MEQYLSVKNINKYFGDFQALKNVSFDVKEGEFVCILGPSGCGKTTLLRLIAGFEDITLGNIILFNDEIESLPPNKRPVNTVFQQYALFPHLNVFENIAFGLRRLNKSNSFVDKRTKEVLKLVQMQDFSNRKPNQLSGGQQQRVALARALAPEPKLLLLDEPLSALDLKLRQAMRIELKNLQRETGITFVFVTHDQEEALTMSDRIAVINLGKVQQIGTPIEIYEYPKNEFVANFIGEANLFNAICQENGKFGKCKLETGHILKMQIPKKISKGDKIRIFIRPERIKITKTNKKNIKSFIYKFTYLGNAAQIIVKSNNLEINVNLSIDKVRDFKEGEKAHLEFDKNYLQIMS